MKFSIKSFFSKCDQIRSFLRIWSHLLKKSLTENFFFGSVINQPSKCLRFGPYTGENGSAKTQILACFMQCWSQIENCQYSSRCKH